MTKRKRKHGLHTRYYDNGQILSEVHYNDGKLVDEYIKSIEDIDL